jgi:hypothetical protein
MSQQTYKQLKNKLSININDKECSVGYGSIGNRPQIDMNKPINEWAYDNAIPHSKYEKEPEKFAHITHEDPDEWDFFEKENELNKHYDNNNEQKRIDFYHYTNGSHLLNNNLIKLHKKESPVYNLHISSYNDIRKLADLTDKTLDKYSTPSPRDFHVYTGIGPSLHINYHRENEGNKMLFPAYTSTSLHPHVTEDFAELGEKPIKKYGEIVRIHIPKNSIYGTYLGAAGLHRNEYEYLLHRGTLLNFTGEPRIVKFRNSIKPLMVHDARIINQSRAPL